MVTHMLEQSDEKEFKNNRWKLIAPLTVGGVGCVVQLHGWQPTKATWGRSTTLLGAVLSTGCGDACIDWLWSCVGGGAVWLGRRSVWGTLIFPKQTLLCIRWSNSGVIHGRRQFFLLRKETIGATSSRAFKNLFFHSNHMLLIPEHVSSSMWRPTASFSRSAWLLFFHFLAVRIWDLFVWVVLTFKIVVTSTWSVMSRCMTWAVVFLSLLV